MTIAPRASGSLDVALDTDQVRGRGVYAHRLGAMAHPADAGVSIFETEVVS